MIDGIRQNLTYLDPSSRKASKAEAGSTSAPRAASPLMGAPSAELVEISAAATAGSTSAPMDKSRIESIRDAIRRNAYPLDFEKLAERMIEADFGLSSGK